MSEKSEQQYAITEVGIVVEIATFPKPPSMIGMRFLDRDTGIRYIWDGEMWVQLGDEPTA